MHETELHLLVAEAVSKELQVDISEINPATHLANYGLNSIHAITLAGELERKLLMQVDFSNIINLNNINELVSFFAKTLQQKSASHSGIRLQLEHSPLTPPLDQQMIALKSSNLFFNESNGLATPVVEIDGHRYLSFSSYNYLGFAHNEEIIKATIDAIKTYGTSACASRVAGGQKKIHRELEESIAGFLQVEDALVINSGHATNVTTIGHLMQSNDLILLDELSHNSLVQGAYLSGATIKFFSHNNIDSLRHLLSEYCSQFTKTLVVTEGIFSMDGDIPPLDKYVALKSEFTFFLYVDEAHSLGVLGQSGRGIGEYFGLNRSEVDVWMGTLSKAFASSGGYIAGSKRLIDHLKFNSPGFVYSCGLSPADSAAALASLNKIKQTPERVYYLQQLSIYLAMELSKHHIPVQSYKGVPIIPIILGDEEITVHVCSALRRKNIYLQAILPPAIPAEQSRLRIFVNHAHTKENIDYLVKTLARVLQYQSIGKQFLENAQV